MRLGLTHRFLSELHQNTRKLRHLPEIAGEVRQGPGGDDGLNQLPMALSMASRRVRACRSSCGPRGRLQAATGKRVAIFAVTFLQHGVDQRTPVFVGPGE
jgi:hypothetical protein